MTEKTQQATSYRSRLPGVEAMYRRSEHAFPRHAHDQYGIGLITRGAQKSWSAVGTVESVVGDVIMVNPGEMHDGSPIGGAREWHMLYLEPDVVARELADECLGDLMLQPVAHDRLLADEVTKLLGALRMPDACGDPEELLLACLASSVQRHRLSGPSLPHASPSVARAIEWMKAEPQADTSLSALASACDVSRFQLIRSFMREVGTTPHAYRMQLRLQVARRHLAQGRAIAEVALLTGFADQSHLTRAFVRQVGITPGRYRAAMHGDSQRWPE